MKSRYREDPAAARITLTARGSQVDAPDASDRQLDSLLRKTERYCTVLQTLTGDPRMPIELHRAGE